MEPFVKTWITGATDPDNQQAQVAALTQAAPAIEIPLRHGVNRCARRVTLAVSGTFDGATVVVRARGTEFEPVTANGSPLEFTSAGFAQVMQEGFGPWEALEIEAETPGAGTDIGILLTAEF